MDSNSPLYSILRIKRKLTSLQSPLDALLIDSTTSSSNKRRRQLGPTAAATPPAAPFLQAAPRGIFHFAATVPLSHFNSATQTQKLKERINACLFTPPITPTTTSTTSTSSTTSTRKPPSSAASLRRPGGATATAESQSPQLRKQQRVQGFHDQGKRARYRIIERQRSTAQGLGAGAGWGTEGHDSQTSPSRGSKVDLSEGARGGARPPVVRSSADLAAQAAAAQADQTRIYDAVEEQEALTPRHAHLLPSSKNVDEDAEMTSQFATMLEEYLTLQDPTPTPSIPSTSTSPAPPPPPPPAPLPPTSEDGEEEEEEEYVYDVYYRDLREPAIAALAGGALGAGGVDVSGLEGLKRVGELAGLEEDEILADGGEQSDEELDEDDQDSNEENDYRNDYPDGEDQESDFSGDGEGGAGGGGRGWGGEEDSDGDGEEW